MRKITLMAAVILVGAFAQAANIPNATDVGALRLGPQAVVAAGASSAFGGGAALWVQYDGSWFGFEARLGGHVLKPENGSTTSARWENEYFMYLFKGKFRPYFAPAAGLCYYAADYDAPAPGWGNWHDEGLFPLLAGYFGVRLNSTSSPFYLTFDGGYKYVDDQGFGTIRNRYFFALTETVALRAGFEAAATFGEPVALGYALVDVGPCFSF